MLDKRQLIRSFNHSAKTCDQANTLQEEVGSRLLDRLTSMRVMPSSLLHLGTSTGFFTSKLMEAFPDAHAFGVDIAKQRLFEHKNKEQASLLCADIEMLPFKDKTMDLVFSNLVLHWCNDLEKIFSKVRHLLKSDGLFLFSMLGVDTLFELCESVQQISDKAHVHEFMDMHEVGDILLKTGFQNPVVDREKIILTYPSVDDLLHDLKATGASNKRSDRMRGLIGKDFYKKLVETYEKNYTIEGLISVTFEVIYGYAQGRFSLQSQTANSKKKRLKTKY